MTDRTYDAWLAVQTSPGLDAAATGEVRGATYGTFLSALADQETRKRVDAMLDAGLSLRVIGKRVGLSHATVGRYKERTAATRTARVSVTPTLPSGPRSVAKRALDHAAEHFDNYRDRVSYDRLEAARAVWESTTEGAQ